MGRAVVGLRPRRSGLDTYRPVTGYGDVMRMDREYAACTFVVVGLELSRQTGELAVSGAAALAVRAEDWLPLWRVHAQVGIGADEADRTRAESRDVVRCGSLGEALAVIDRRITEAPHVAVARLGRMEAATFWEQRASCPRLASLVLWDAMRLAQIACPAVAEPSEAALASALGIGLPERGAPVTRAVWATSEICRRALQQGISAGRWATFRQVEDLVGRRPRPVEEHYLPSGPVQDSLFD